MTKRIKENRPDEQESRGTQTGLRGQETRSGNAGLRGQETRSGTKPRSITGQTGQKSRGAAREYMTMEKAERLIREIASDPRARQLRSYIQHGSVTTYDHCISVARLSCRLAEKWHLKVDAACLVRGAFLHDYYLYDWHTRGDHLHGYHHPKIASRRAAEDFGLSSEERHIIESHMWPLTLFHAPASREAMLVCLADKICSVRETGAGRRGPEAGEQAAGFVPDAENDATCLDSPSGNRYDGEVSSERDSCPGEDGG